MIYFLNFGALPTVTLNFRHKGIKTNIAKVTLGNTRVVIYLPRGH